MARTTFSQPFITPAADESARAHKFAGQAQPRRLGVTAVWRDTLSAFSAHPAAILLFAFAGFALPTIIGSWLIVATKLAEYARTRAVVTLYDRPSFTSLLIQAGLGLLAFTFARGAITWLALQGKQHSEACDNARVGLGAACHAAFVSYPALLMGALLYGACIAAGTVMMSAVTHKLEYVPGKMAHVWAGPQRAFDDMLRQLEWRGFNALMPSAGSPFAEFAPHVRDAAFNQTTRAIYHERYVDRSAQPIIVAETVAETLFISVGEEAIKTFESRPMAVAGVALVFFAETLLRLRAVMAMQPPRSPRPRRFGWLTPLVDSMRFGLRHFRAITIHLWLVQLIVCAFTLTLIEFPVALMQHFLMPNVLRLGGGFEVLPILHFMATASAALVSAIVLALSVVYDAQLFKQLERP
jgi:hypothetical protein